MISDIKKEMSELIAQQNILEEILVNDTKDDIALDKIINRKLVTIYIRLHELERQLYAA